MEEIEHGNNKQACLPFLFDHFDRGGWRKYTKKTRISQSGSFFVSHFSSREKNHIENVPNPFVELCIVSDPNLPGASLP